MSPGCKLLLGSSILENGIVEVLLRHGFQLYPAHLAPQLTSPEQSIP